MHYTNSDTFIFVAININDNWYKRILKNKFEKNICDKVNIYHDKLIRRRKDYYQKKRNHDDEIIFMKINFIEHRKRKNFKDQ